MDVLASDVPALDAMQPLPPGIRLVHEPGPGIRFAVFGPELLEQVAETVGRLPDLEVLQTASAGLDSVLPHVPSRVTVCGASGAHDVAVSEWVIAGLLAATRRLIPFYDAQREGRWERDEDDLMGVSPGPIGPVEDLEGAMVLVIGYGSIGRAVGHRLEPFGARVVGVTARKHDDTVTIDRLPDLLPEAAAVVLLTPLTDATRGIVDDAFLSRMRPGAVLVNAARGPVVDTDALVRALAARRIHAVLDVTDPEPLPHDHPLWSAPNVLITPHVAGTTTAWLRRAYRLAGEQLRRYVAGEPLANAQPGRA